MRLTDDHRCTAVHLFRFVQLKLYVVFALCILQLHFPFFLFRTVFFLLKCFLYMSFFILPILNTKHNGISNIFKLKMAHVNSLDSNNQLSCKNSRSGFPSYVRKSHFQMYSTDNNGPTAQYFRRDSNGLRILAIVFEFVLRSRHKCLPFSLNHNRLSQNQSKRFQEQNYILCW